MLHLRTFGGLSIEGAEVANNAAAQRRNLVLLALVAASPGGISRDKLLGYLSPELPEDRARNTLRQRIYALRHGLHDELFLGTTDLRLNPAVVSVDLWEFEDAMARGDMVRAGQVYRGPFLDGIFLKELPELEGWIEDRRAELARKAARVFTTVATDAAASKQYDAAVDAWRRLSVFEPAAAAPAIGLINALAQAGDAPGALDHYRAYCTLLRDQYELEPDTRVTAAAETVRESVRAASGNGHAKASGDPGNSGNAGNSGNGSRYPWVDGAENGARNGGNGRPGRNEHGKRTSPPQGAPDVASAESARAEAPEHQTPRTAVGAGRGRGSGRRSRMLLGAAVALVCIAVVGSLMRSGAAEASEASRRVLVLPFTNETGRPEFDALASSATTKVELALASERVAEVVDSRSALSGKERGFDTSAPQQELARRLHAGTILTGAFSLRGGDTVVVEASIVDVESGAIADVISPVTAHRDSAFHLIDALRSRVVGAIAASRDPVFLGITGGSVALPNKEALGAFLDGMVAHTRYDEESSYRNMIAAFRLDTGFVQAALWAAEGADDDSIRILMDYVRARANRLSPLDRAQLEFQEAFHDRRLEDAYIATSTMMRLAPTSWLSITSHAKTAMLTRRYKEAARLYGRIDLATPGLFQRFYVDAGEAYHAAKDYRSELALYDAGKRAYPGDYAICASSLNALAAIGKLDELRQRIDDCTRLWAGGKLRGRIKTNGFAASELLVHQHGVLADSLWNASVQLAEAGVKSGELTRADLAQAYYEAAKYALALPLLREAVEDTTRKNPPNAMEMTPVAVAAAMVKDTATTHRYRQQIIDYRNRKGGQDPLALLAQIDAAEGRYDDAMSRILSMANNRLLLRQVYGKRIYQPLWERPDWKSLMSSRD